MCAGMYAGRAMLKAVVLERGFPGGELLNTELIEDYPGFESILGRELAQKMTDHARKFGAVIATYYAPAAMPESERKAYFLRRTVQLLLKKGQPDAQWSEDAERNILKSAVDLNEIEEMCDTDTVIGGVIYRFMTNSSEKNVVHVSVVNANGPANMACPVIKSLTNYF